MVMQLRREGTAAVALPPANIFESPEIVLQIWFATFVLGFMAYFLQQAVAAGDFLGRMLAVERKADQRVDNFKAQDGLYTLVARGQVNRRSVETKQIIGAVSRVLSAETDWPTVIEAAQRPELK